MNSSNIIFVECGQCGNQLGFSMLDTIYAHLDGASDELKEIVFRSDSKNRQYARSVCLDTEPKVINECVKRAMRKRSWQFHPNNIAYLHGGAGNNWALGYDMTSGEFLEVSIDCIRKELEHCDFSPSLVTLHSLAGGTGSGLGTRITEECSDIFPETTRLNIAISPYHFGEVVVQHYNALLTLSKTSQSSHGVLVFENEIAQSLCKTMHGLPNPSLEDINSVISSNLLPLLLPMNSVQGGGGGGATTDPFATSTTYQTTLLDHLSHLCANPRCKFLDIKSTPQTSKKSVNFTYDSWPTLLKTVLKMQLSGASSERHINRQFDKYFSDSSAASPSFSFSSGTGLGPANMNMAQPPATTTPRDRSHDATGLEGVSNLNGNSYSNSSMMSSPPSVLKSVASSISFHGMEARDAAVTLYKSSLRENGSNSSSDGTPTKRAISSNSNYGSYSGGSASTPASLKKQQQMVIGSVIVNDPSKIWHHQAIIMEAAAKVEIPSATRLKPPQEWSKIYNSMISMHQACLK